MNYYGQRRSFPTLSSLSIDCIINNLYKLQGDDLSSLAELPKHIKSRMLHLFTVSPYFWTKVDFKTILKLFLHENLEHLNLTACTLDDDILKLIYCCKNLKELHLTRIGHHHITTNGLMNLFPHLKHIFFLNMLNCEAVTDDIVETITNHCPNIGGLDVGGCVNVTDRSMDALSTLHHLQWLNCSQTQVSDDGVLELVKGPSGEQLKELRVADCPNISQHVLNIVSKHCPNMRILIFFNCKTITGKIATTLANAQTLVKPKDSVK